jgi:hypothetical protein
MPIEEGQEADLLLGVIERADRVFVKKLSNNDRDWSTNLSKHQGGVYIRAENRDGGFFPPLVSKARNEAGAREIREVFFRTVWPQFENAEKETRLTHYTSKGQETHLTRLPKEAFAILPPASFFIMARTPGDGPPQYVCLTIASDTEEAQLIVDLLGLEPEFIVGEFDPQAIAAAEREHVLTFSEELVNAWISGTFEKFAAAHATFPDAPALARAAQQEFFRITGHTSLNPFLMDFPGNALEQISRHIEFEIMKDFQRREVAVRLVKLLFGSTPRQISSSGLLTLIVENVQTIDKLMLSVSQRRRSRAGLSYELHIERMLFDGRIPFQKQVVVTTGKRPDFVLPSLAALDAHPDRGAFILSSKTTLRERWKQVEREMGGRPLYLATVDEGISGAAIRDMASIGVHLVIPERLLRAKETEYDGHPNVMTMKAFSENIVRPRLPVWRS